MSESVMKFESTYEPSYAIICSNCGYDRKVRGRLQKCPECNIFLIEKRFLF